jgi:ribosome-associated translation inhibitor RaiA
MVRQIHGLRDAGAFRALVAGRLTAALARLHRGAARADVGFADENGSKGGPAVRCAITVTVPSRRAVHTEHRAAAPRAAFDGAFTALVRELERYVDRGRESRRRPKKYYVAKRLLEPPAPQADTGA